jgi:hypothetical protein
LVDCADATKKAPSKKGFLRSDADNYLCGCHCTAILRERKNGAIGARRACLKKGIEFGKFQFCLLLFIVLK